MTSDKNGGQPPATRSKARSVLPGDRVFYWREEEGKLVAMPAFIDRHLEISNTWNITVLSNGIMIPHPGTQYSRHPKEFCWTFADQVTPMMVVENTPDEPEQPETAQVEQETEQEVAQVEQVEQDTNDNHQEPAFKKRRGRPPIIREMAGVGAGDEL